MTTMISALAALLLTAIALPETLLHAQTASFGGTVLIDPTEKPLANAEIVFTALNWSVRRDTAGNFLFSGRPVGKHAVVVRLVGYESLATEITLTNNKPLEVDLLLKPNAQRLAKVVVKTAGPFAMKLAEFDERRATNLTTFALISSRLFAQGASFSGSVLADPSEKPLVKLAEFEDRRRSGAGRYLTADVFEAQGGRPMSAFLTQHVPGLRVIQSGSRHWLSTSSRGINSQSKSQLTLDKIPLGCYVQVIVNGMVLYDGSQPMFDIDNEINSATVIGFEFHTTATTPAQYNKMRGTSGCGTVIIWTK